MPTFQLLGKILASLGTHPLPARQRSADCSCPPRSAERRLARRCRGNRVQSRLAFAPLPQLTRSGDGGGGGGVPLCYPFPSTASVEDSVSLFLALAMMARTAERHLHAEEAHQLQGWHPCSRGSSSRRNEEASRSTCSGGGALPLLDTGLTRAARSRMDKGFEVPAQEEAQRAGVWASRLRGGSAFFGASTRAPVGVAHAVNTRAASRVVPRWNCDGLRACQARNETIPPHGKSGGASRSPAAASDASA
jgi:hypothetical protein